MHCQLERLVGRLLQQSEGNLPSEYHDQATSSAPRSSPSGKVDDEGRPSTLTHLKKNDERISDCQSSGPTPAPTPEVQRHPHWPYAQSKTSENVSVSSKDYREEDATVQEKDDCGTKNSVAAEKNNSGRKTLEEGRFGEPRDNEDRDSDQSDGAIVDPSREEPTRLQSSRETRPSRIPTDSEGMGKDDGDGVHLEMKKNQVAKIQATLPRKMSSEDGHDSEKEILEEEEIPENFSEEDVSEDTESAGGIAGTGVAEGRDIAKENATGFATTTHSEIKAPPGVIKPSDTPVEAGHMSPATDTALARKATDGQPDGISEEESNKCFPTGGNDVVDSRKNAMAESRADMPKSQPTVSSPTPPPPPASLGVNAADRIQSSPLASPLAVPGSPPSPPAGTSMSSLAGLPLPPLGGVRSRGGLLGALPPVTSRGIPSLGAGINNEEEEVKGETLLHRSTALGPFTSLASVTRGEEEAAGSYPVSSVREHALRAAEAGSNSDENTSPSPSGAVVIKQKEGDGHALKGRLGLDGDAGEDNNDAEDDTNSEHGLSAAPDSPRQHQGQEEEEAGLRTLRRQYLGDAHPTSNITAEGGRGDRGTGSDGRTRADSGGGGGEENVDEGLFDLGEMEDLLADDSSVEEELSFEDKSSDRVGGASVEGGDDDDYFS